VKIRDFQDPRKDLDSAGILRLDLPMSATTAAQLLREVLEQKLRRGRTHVQVASQDLEKLRGVRKVDRARTAKLREEERAELGRVADTAAEPAAEEDKRLIAVDGETLAEKIAHLAARAEEATEPRALGTLRSTMVFSVGNPEADLMLVGEAPGYEEERQREPFVGPAGQRLTKILKAMGLARSDVYISNICKFRPAIEGSRDQGTRNRAPSKAEMDACLPFVLTELDLIQPKVVVALGRTAAEGLGIEGSVGSIRGRFHDVKGIPTMATYHPSYILRAEQDADGGLKAKSAVWSDMLMVMERAGMEISEKQRGYFKGR
jgi:DNA polymerase